MQFRGSSVIMAFMVAGMVFGLWYMLEGMEGPPARRERPENPSQEVVETADSSLTVADRTQRARSDLSGYLPGWIEGKGLPAMGNAGVDGDVPRLALELAGLCVGRTIASSSTPAVKRAISALVQSDLSQEEIDALAAYFAAATNPALRFQLMVAFRYIPNAAFVQPVSAAYSTNPLAALECLQFLSSQCPSAFEAFDSLLATEEDPRFRENIIARAGFQGVPSAESFLQKTFREGAGHVDRRAALIGLSKIDSTEARNVLQSVLNGEREQAVYDIALGPPSHDALTDLRAHAVIGVLQNGAESDVERLLDRFCEQRGHADAIGGYVLNFLSVVETARFVPRIVELMKEENKVDLQLLAYVEARSNASHYDLVQSLLGLQNDEATTRRLTNVLGRLH